jgi:Xaa-Pro aminopeptidase
MRLREFKQILKKKEIDMAILLHPDVNITYFTQVVPSYAIFLVSQRSAEIYMTSLDDKPELKGIAVKTLKKGWENKIKSKEYRKIGLNYSTITMSAFKKLKKLFPKAKFVDIAEDLTKLRSVKTEEELKLIKKACKITDNAFETVIDKLGRGKFRTELEVSNFIEREFKDSGAELAFPSIVAMGKNAAIPHYCTGKQKLKKGFLLFDIGAKYKNYCADMSRTIFLGTISNKEKDVYNQLIEAQKGAIRNANIGMKLSELDKLTRKSLGKYSSYFIHSLGHGLGIEIHEKPSFSEESNDKIIENQVFTIEPGVYFPGKFGLRIEDTNVFSNRLKQLTKSNKELITIKI